MPVAAEQLERGRDAYAREAWLDAHRALSQADEAAALESADLWRLAVCAYMLGRDEEVLRGLERAYQAHLEPLDLPGAVRCAFWLGVQLAMRGETGAATGWFARVRRLYERGEPVSAEHGYVLSAAALLHAAAGEWHDAAERAADAARVGERFAEADVLALGLQDQGRALLRLGRPQEGLRLLDEAMAGVTAGEVSPIVAGLLYCSVIDGCQEAHDLRRAAEWTAALSRWCERQRDLVPFTGQCLLHRAEIMQLRGAWPDALEESRRAAGRFGARAQMSRTLAGQAFYRQGEVHRLRGEHGEAETAYREASRWGWEPQPGLGLLRLAQGRREAAAAAIRRAVDEAADPIDRARLLPAHVEIMVAVGELDAAREGCRELERLAASHPSDMLAALAAMAGGAVALASDDARAALPELRRAWRLWEELEVPYEAARARALVGLACRALGDEEGGALELAGAREAFAELGAAPDVERVDALHRPAATARPAGLTPRELEVLRLVAGGETNRAIAAALVLSERTVDRHVSNILAKLGVPSRAAATAYAYRHGLV